MGTLKKKAKRGPYNIKEAPLVEPNLRQDGSVRSYSVRVRVNGKQVRKTFANREQADAFVALIMSEKLAPLVGSNQYEKVAPTMERVVRTWLDEANIYDATRKAYRVASKHVIRNVGSIKASELKTSDVVAMLDDITKTMTATANSALAVLKGSLAWGEEKFEYDAQKIDWKEVRKSVPDGEDSIHFLAPEEIKVVVAAAYEAIAEGLLDEFVAPAMELTLLTGLRMGELLGLKVENIDLKRKKLHVRNTVAQGSSGGAFLKDGTKAGKKKYRTLPLTPKATEAVTKLLAIRAAYMKKYNCETPFLITRIRYRVRTEGREFVRLKEWWRQVKKLAKILENKGIALSHCNNLTPHVFRHTFATSYLMRTRGEFRSALIALQGYMGHKNIETTTSYLHVVEADGDNSVSVLDELF